MDSPDVIGLTETWEKSAYVLQGYHPALRKDRPAGKLGGGVMLFVKSNINVIECPELNAFTFGESVWCILKPGKTRILIGLCYRSPASTQENNENLIELFKKAYTMNVTNILIMGDFNYGRINWADGTVPGSQEGDAVKFFEMTQDLLLHQHVDFPTRYQEGCVPSLLDLVISDDEMLIENLTSESPLGKSDHVVIKWLYFYENPKVQKTQRSTLALNDDAMRNYRKGNYEDMSLALVNTDWTVLESMDVENAWQLIVEEIKKNVKKYVPLKKKVHKTRQKDPWWSPALMKEVKKKHQKWKEYRNDKTQENYAKYKTQRNTTTQLIRQARRQYEKKIIDSMKKEPKRLYKYIRSKQKVKDIVGPLEKDDGTLTETELETAEVLHKFFQSIFIADEDDNIPVIECKVPEGRELEDIEITPEIVYKELKSLNPNKASGPDDIRPSILQACAGSLAKPLSILFRKTLEERTLPNDWKMAKITPIFKKGGRKSANNYRPVA